VKGMIIKMIKILTACGTGINTSQQIKNSLQNELTARGYEVSCDAVVINNITEEMLSHYDIFAPISKVNFGFEVPIPQVIAGPILYRVSAMAEPVYQEVTQIIDEMKK